VKPCSGCSLFLFARDYRHGSSKKETGARFYHTGRRLCPGSGNSALPYGKGFSSTGFFQSRPFVCLQKKARVLLSSCLNGLLFNFLSYVSFLLRCALWRNIVFCLMTGASFKMTLSNLLSPRLC
jgi:hypothetical protein